MVASEQMTGDCLWLGERNDKLSEERLARKVFKQRALQVAQGSID
jgi:hypothetical protein